jgi:dihydroflavonol-4-reductase
MVWEDAQRARCMHTSPRNATGLPIVCVTGASGYLATEIVAQLLESGRYNVHGTVRSLACHRLGRKHPLETLPGAAERLKLFEANLLDPGSFDHCFEGVRFLFHTASPFVTDGITDAQAQLIDPAVNGTCHVLQSAVAANVKRAVVTSSVGAIMGSFKEKSGFFNEDDWNTSSSLSSDNGLDLYRLSKKLAEQAAWEISSQHGLELAAINPSFIIGPPRMPRRTGESLSFMRAFLDGGVPHRGDSPIADIRDVARAHILAAELPAAAGKRFLISTPGAVRNAEVARLLAAKFPELGISDLGEPAPVRRELFRSKNTGSILGLHVRPHRESVLDMAERMLSLLRAGVRFGCGPRPHRWRPDLFQPATPEQGDVKGVVKLRDYDGVE